MSTYGSRLKALRLSAVPSPTIRAIAQEALGWENHNNYSYLEGQTRPDKPIEIEVARKIATYLAARGVDPAAVMALAGLTAEEASVESKQIAADRDAPPQVIALPVMLPNVETLSQMIVGLFEGAGQPVPSDELARTLARLLPDALRQALDQPLFRRSVTPPPVAADSPPRARKSRAKPQQPRI